VVLEWFQRGFSCFLSDFESFWVLFVSFSCFLGLLFLFPLTLGLFLLLLVVSLCIYALLSPFVSFLFFSCCFLHVLL